MCWTLGYQNFCQILITSSLPDIAGMAVLETISKLAKKENKWENVPQQKTFHLGLHNGSSF